MTISCFYAINSDTDRLKKRGMGMLDIGGCLL